MFEVDVMEGSFLCRGLRASHIFFNATEGMWVLQSLKNPEKRSKLLPDFSSTNFPLGRLKWEVNVSNVFFIKDLSVF